MNIEHVTDTNRISAPTEPESILLTSDSGTICKITVDRAAKAVTRDGESIHFTKSEFKIIDLLSRRFQGTFAVRTKAMFLDHLYPERGEARMKTIDVLVCKLRKKLAGTGREDYIPHVWGRGYCLQEHGKGWSPQPLGMRPDRPVCVMGYDGAVFAVYELPEPETVRWVASRKAQIVCAVKGRMLTEDEAYERYGVLPEELQEWMTLYGRFGLRGLRTGCTQRYRED